MSTLLELPKGENSLIAAYQAVMEANEATAQSKLVELYQHHFVTVAPPSSVQAPVFEIFSIVDPTIRTTVRASTDAR